MKSLLTSAIIVTSIALDPYTAHAAQFSTKLAAQKMQEAENSIASAIKTGDLLEIRRQHAMLIRLHQVIAETENAELRTACEAAFQSLANIALTVIEPAAALRLVSPKRDILTYRTNAPKCEGAFFLEVPAQPNLR
ncbi:hypothetical protein ACQVP2_30595 [Methylobacterium aquaticum]|uniref:hypothetical protein n=1 Tax=Methylobacterium aquaticum TaxID=270351 RepID=UPI003D175B92